MNRSKISIILGVILLLVSSCADDSLGPILTFDKAGKGAYVRLVKETNKLINLFDIAGSKYTYSVELVDEARGANITEYNLELYYKDAEKSDGDASKGPIQFRKFESSQFIDSERGYKGINDITITANEVLAAAGLTPDKVNPGDQFRLEGTVVLKDGSRYTYENSSATVQGSAFQSHFRFILPAACPSSLEGSYAFKGSDFWCDGGSADGTVKIIAKGGGVYSFDDWSFGSYNACYGGLASSWGTLAFSDVCNKVSFTGLVDNYGDTWTFVSSVNGTEWTIEWSSTYGEAGKAVIINPKGWSFTIK